MIIWLASYPRSGNTFFRLVLRQVFGLDTYSVYDEHGVDDRQVELVGGATADNLDSLAFRPQPHAVKTHELPGNDSHAAIYLVRDGRDVIVSYANYIRSMHIRAAKASGESSPPPEPAAIMRDLIEHEHSFGGWGRHVESWMRRVPRATLVKFNDLIADPVNIVADAMRCAGAPMPQRDAHRLPTFEALQRDMPEFFRAGRTGGYRQAMPANLQAAFMGKYGHIMRCLGYPA